MSDELKGIGMVCATLIIIAFAFASCQVNADRERTKALTVCLEKNERASECIVIGDSYNSGGRR